MTDGKLEFTGDVRKLEEELDSEIRFRPLLPPAGMIVTSLLIALSLFHYYTAGFGLLRETTHRGIHMAFVLGLIFLVFPFLKSSNISVAMFSVVWRWIQQMDLLVVWKSQTPAHLSLCQLVQILSDASSMYWVMLSTTAQKLRQRLAHLSTVKLLHMSPKRRKWKS